MMPRKLLYPGAILLLLVTMAVVAIVFNRDRALMGVRIEARREALRMQLNAVSMPSFDNDPIADEIPVTAPDSPTGIRQVFRARLGQQLVGVFILVETVGYAGKIRLLVAILADGTVGGVSLISQKETRGYGDRLAHEASVWFRLFDGRSLRDPVDSNWRLRREGGEFDAVSGATVTSRGIVDGVHAALLWFDRHRHEITGEPGR